MGLSNFCEEEVEWTELIDVFQEIYNKSTEIKDVEVLQGIALARVLKTDIEEFLDKLTTISLKGLICTVLANYDIDEEIDKVTDEIETLFSEFNSFDDQIASINGDGFSSLSEIENAVYPIFENFISSKEDLERAMDEKLKEMFKPLTELGASELQIEEAFKEVQFEDNPANYIMDIFLTIADKTIQDIG